MLILVEPAAREEPANEAVDRALRGIERAHELGERHARRVDDRFEDARDAIDRAVVLRHALRGYRQRADLLMSHRALL